MNIRFTFTYIHLKNRSAKLDVLGDRVEKHCRAFLHVHVSAVSKKSGTQWSRTSKIDTGTVWSLKGHVMFMKSTCSLHVHDVHVTCTCNVHVIYMYLYMYITYM